MAHELKAAGAGPTGRRWHGGRARSLRRPLEVRLDECGTAGAVVGCTRCGQLHEVPNRCNLRWLCDRCRRRTYARVRGRAARALKAHVAAARAAGRAGRGLERRPVLITLTTRHSGDLARDRRVLVEGWRKLRQWCHKRLKATTGRGQFEYALVWECTPGEDGRGHVHAHVVVLWPWIRWQDVHKEWVRATAGESVSIDLETGACSVGKAVHYLAKYASKGVELSEFTPDLAARAIDAQYGKRLVSTSHGFWLTEERRACGCGGEYRVRELPPRREFFGQPVWASHAPFLVDLEVRVSRWRSDVFGEDRRVSRRALLFPGVVVPTPPKPC